jgi:putative hydrolase of the HAD superfamily
VRGVLVDVGGVLVEDRLAAASAAWAQRLGMSQDALLRAVFGGSDDGILVGRVDELTWWKTVQRRLDIDDEELALMNRALTRLETPDRNLVATLHGLEGVSLRGIVSNAWPGARHWMSEQGLLDVVEVTVLSCEVGYAKPDPRIFEIALERLGLAPADVLFVDDYASHIEMARRLGMLGHVHRSSQETVEVITDFVNAKHAC